HGGEHARGHGDGDRHHHDDGVGAAVDVQEGHRRHAPPRHALRPLDRRRNGCGGMTRIPGDLDRPDRFLLGLTARQLLLVAPAFTVITILAWVLTPVVPIWTLMPILAVLAGGAIAMTMIKQDGMSPDQVAGHVVRYLRSPRRLVSAPEGTPPVPRRLRGLRPRMRLGHFKEPWRGFRGGDIDVGDACVRLLAVSSLDLQLRSEKETRVLTEGFGRLLNALDDSLCVIVRGEPIDLEEAALA